RIDIEDSTTTTNTFKIFTELKKQYSNVGVAIQAYLRRSLDDVNNTLIPASANIRVCKGIYVEKQEIAYKDYEIIRKNFAYLVEKLLSAGCYVGIATHDEMLIWEGIKIVDRLGLKKDQYEFQMLLGVNHSLRDTIVKEGHRMRIYVPFGEDWHPYCIRRMKENPAIAGHVMKAFFKRT
ncbi:MAG: proline dehydrogenase family protein, partial [Candidatus Eremiobacteraeota bacterium]|nr:proline dehydrogenase family protein [Candidatus Eremiobacteraeota bacterium]